MTRGESETNESKKRGECSGGKIILEVGGDRKHAGEYDVCSTKHIDFLLIGRDKNLGALFLKDVLSDDLHMARFFHREHVIYGEKQHEHDDGQDMKG